MANRSMANHGMANHGMANHGMANHGMPTRLALSIYEHLLRQIDSRTSLHVDSLRV